MNTHSHVNIDSCDISYQSEKDIKNIGLIRFCLYLSVKYSYKSGTGPQITFIIWSINKIIKRTILKRKYKEKTSIEISERKASTSSKDIIFHYTDCTKNCASSRRDLNSHHRCSSSAAWCKPHRTSEADTAMMIVLIHSFFNHVQVAFSNNMETGSIVCLCDSLQQV